jgi:hypothetical protein
VSRKLWLIVAACAAAIAVVVWLNPPAQEYSRIASPDGNYRVIVYRYPQLLPVMPGQASDAPGRLDIYSRSGKLLHTEKIEMVQFARDLRWYSDAVSIPGAFRWELPKDPLQ